MRCTIIICSRGRPAILDVTIRSLLRQTMPAHAIVLSLAGPEDATPATRALPEVTTLIGPLGLTLQRNYALDRLPEGTDCVIFLDDDVIVRRDLLAATQRFFATHHDVAVATCTIIAKGHEDDKVSLDEGQGIIDEDERSFDALGPVPAAIDVPNAIGCLMAMPVAVARGIRFDERLRYYAWLEDMDASVGVRRFGRLCSSPSLRLVHLRTPVGRMPNQRVGFSQIMNPYYLYRKGTFSESFLAMLVRYWGRVLVSNLSASLSWRQAVNRRGRLRGNLRALGMIARGRIEPEAVDLIPAD